MTPSLAAFVAVMVAVSWMAGTLLSQAAGPDPAKWLLHQSGFLALCALVATLAVSSVRRWLERPSLAAWRRPVGLAAFSLVALHVFVYVTVYQGLAWQPILDDVGKRPYLLLGLAAFLLLVPMAATSTRGARRRLGRHWDRLHRAIYVIVPLAVIHQGMAQKADLGETLVFAAFCGCFLIERAWHVLRGKVKSKKSEKAC